MLTAQRDLKGALAAYREALDFARTIAAKYPGNPGRQRDVLLSLIKVGAALAAQGDRAGALAAYEEAVEIARKLATQHQDNPQAQSDLALSLYNLGTVADPPQARAALTERSRSSKSWNGRRSLLTTGRIGPIWFGPRCQSCHDILVYARFW